ncbi:helix-turn-helix domain-containing protein [Aquabacterium parvum]|jgi:transcriptional regulator with XRE-family HTH domain|uniref:helix-turn-helix domain-containing protein n=1 Tax=Aquabacterium parvum TaxID=70584 RepID=UPI000718B4E9|nr:helix-turn-helix domain-containing protein [Aquabacterium parvum]MBU0915434.1 helix-turn-helix domain-containing protein [Gammaproteobacteria bacterium]
MLPPTPAPVDASVSALLKAWRQLRRLPQLELALAAGVSQRHLSFIESGRSKPSRGLLLGLAETLDLPLRERNLLLQAGGFAPVFAQRGLSDDDMACVRQALALVLDHQEPYPAIVLDRQWNTLLRNRAAEQLIGLLGEPADVWQRVDPSGQKNILRLCFHPQGMRPLVRNWEQVAPHMLERLQREIVAAPMDLALRELHRDLWAMAELRQAGHEDLASTGGRPKPTGTQVCLSPTVNVELGVGDITLRLFSLLSTFGTAQDVTTDELRIETFFPADDFTATFFKKLAG